MRLRISAASAGGNTPANTLEAALNVVRNPANKVAAVYGVAAASTIFQPALAAAPPDWLLSTTIKGGGMNIPTSVSIASTGAVWVSSYNNVVSEFLSDGTAVSATGFSGSGINESYGIALDAHDNVWIANEQTGPGYGLGSITKLSSSGQALSGSGGFTSGGIWFPVAIAADPNGNMWIANNGHVVTLLDSNGDSLSGGGGFASSSLDFPQAIAVDANHNAWVGNQADSTLTRISSGGSQGTTIACCDGAAGIAIDQSGNVWTANYYGNSVSRITNAGTAVPSFNVFKGTGIYGPEGIASDGSGNIWVASRLGSTLMELSGSSTASPGAFLSPATGFGADTGLLSPYGVAIDASGNVWISNSGNDTLTQFIGAATPVKTPLVGPAALP